MHPRRAISSIVALIGLAALISCASHPPPVTAITVVTDPAPFASIEEAARAETRVNWWDGDFTDDDACTRSFAAAELARWLPRAFGLPPGAVRFPPPCLTPVTW